MGDGHSQSPTGSPSEAHRLEAIDWSFPGADTQYLTHGFHPYPARMIPQIPDRLLTYFLDAGVIAPGDRLFDPFCGSGTSLVEARRHGLHGEGIDINPLACMLSLAKAKPLDPTRLTRARAVLFEGVSSEFARITRAVAADEPIDLAEPAVNDGWFPTPQLYHLAILRERIDELEDQFTPAIARFFRVALAKTTRVTSYQRNGEFKRYRIPEADRADHQPDVLSIFREEVQANLAMMRRYRDCVDPSLDTVVHYADSRAATDVGDATADIVITSPPYGDHATTVAYGQYSRDPAIICGNYGYDEMKSVDKRGLGGSASGLEPLDDLEMWSPSLHATLETLREQDGRTRDAMQFFRDYVAVIKQVKRILRPGHPVAWVVANRTVSRVTIPTHFITRELCAHLGFDHVQTVPREIPNKTMPWKNAPENIPNQTGDLMAEEHIVLLTGPEETTT